ncbi:hypothetical protein ACOSQ4_033091 [Xanthoceras sorbifolium]
MSSKSSSSSSEGSTSESSSKSVSSESRSIGSRDDPVESGNHPRSVRGPRVLASSEYNSEDYHQNNLEFSRFAVNRIRENRINNTRLSVCREEFSIPFDVGLRIPNIGEQVSNPEPRCGAIHPAFLEIGMCLPLQPYVRRFLREVGLAPAKLSSNSWRILIGMWCLWRLNGIDTNPTFSEIKHCYKLVGHTRDGDGWWHLSSWTKLAGHSLIIKQPSSNKEELTIGGREQRVRSVFGFLGTWERVHEKDLTVEERDHINSAWGTRSDHRHIDYLLDVRVLASVNIIPEPSSLRLANSKRSFGKKKEDAPSRKGKSVASKRPRRTISLKRERQRSRSPSTFHRPPMGSGVPPTFTSTRPGVSQSSVDVIFSPDQSVDFICDNARNFMRSTDPCATGKMSNDDRIRIATGQFYTAIGNFRHQEMRLVELHHQLEHTEAELIHKKDMLRCTQRDLGESREEVARLKAQVASLEKKAAKGAKAEEYRGRLKDARRPSTMNFSEVHTQYLVSKVDLNFDFEKFEEIKAAEWGTGEATEKADSPKEEEDSLLVADVELSGEKVEEVGSGGEATDHFDSEGLLDHFDWRLDFLIISIGGWSRRQLLDYFVRGVYLSVGLISSKKWNLPTHHSRGNSTQKSLECKSLEKLMMEFHEPHLLMAKVANRLTTNNESLKITSTLDWDTPGLVEVKVGGTPEPIGVLPALDLPHLGGTGGIALKGSAPPGTSCSGKTGSDVSVVVHRASLFFPLIPLISSVVAYFFARSISSR